MFFTRIRLLWCFVIVSIIIIVLMYIINNTIINTVATTLSAIVVSIIVSVLYNEELHNAMDKYKKIGLVNYYDNFEDAHSVIIDKISKAKDVDIFVMYGDSFLNTSTRSILSLLSKENSNLRYVMYSLENKFIDSYGYYWGVIGDNPKYNEDGLKMKIKGVRLDLKKLIEKKHNNCSFKFYEIQNSPISYSFYRMDEELFFVPNKNINSKEIKPVVFHFKKTKSENSMYNKVKIEFELMIYNNEVKEVDL